MATTVDNIFHKCPRYVKLVAVLALLLLGIMLDQRVALVLLIPVAAVAVAVIAHFALTNFNVLLMFLIVISLILPAVSRLGGQGVDVVQKVMKLFVLFTGIGVWVLKKVMDRRRILMSSSMRLYSIVYFASVAFFLLRSVADFSAYNNPGEIATFFQIYSLPYIFLGIIAYDQTESLEWTVGFCRFLQVSGVIVAVIGIVQWILGPERLMAMGLDLSTSFVYDMRKVADLSDNLFRVFSTLQTGAELSVYMMITILASIYLYLSRVITGLSFFVSIIVMAFALLATQYMTTLVCLLVSTVLSYLLHRKLVGYRHVGDRVKRKSWIFGIAVSLVTIAAIVATNKQFVFRMLNSFTMGQLDERGVQTSMFSRIYFLSQNIEAIRTHPMGLGFGNFQHGFTFSSDNYMLYLVAYGGLLLMMIYGWIYLLPVVVGWREKREIAQGADHDLYLFYSLLWGWITTGLLVGTLSNSQITQASPSNIIFWSSIGIMYKIPVLVRTGKID